MINNKFLYLKSNLDSSFAKLQETFQANDNEKFICSLAYINTNFGTKLKYMGFDKFDSAMRCDKPLEFW